MLYCFHSQVGLPCTYLAHYELGTAQIPTKVMSTSATEHIIGVVTCRSVVVAVRGTATMEDVITDSVAAPDLLDRSEWLPESFKQQQAQTGL